MGRHSGQIDLIEDRRDRSNNGMREMERNAPKLLRFTTLGEDQPPRL